MRIIMGIAHREDALYTNGESLLANCLRGIVFCHNSYKGAMEHTVLADANQLRGTYPYYQRSLTSP